MKGTALIIMPRSSYAWKGSEALWVTAAGWASAAQRRFGEAWVITADHVVTPREAYRFPLGTNAEPTASRIRSAPGIATLAAKDAMLWWKSGWRIPQEKLRWSPGKVVFIWEQHDIFPGPGRKLADTYRVPLVKYIHAPIVWEGEKWGSHRGWWGRYLEKKFEVRGLRQADLVACVSAEVRNKLVEMGIDRDRILISPMAVDPDLFPEVQVESSKNHLVVGWTGSFRKFHGIDVLVRAFAKAHQAEPGTRLRLVGDGPEREAAKRLVAELSLSGKVEFVGRKPFLEIPAEVSTFDIAVVSSRPGDDFHYSPLKLREYLMAGKVSVAPNVGEIRDGFKGASFVKRYDAGSVDGLAHCLVGLIRNPEQLDKLGAEARSYASTRCTWDVELNKILEKQHDLH